MKLWLIGVLSYKALVIGGSSSHMKLWFIGALSYEALVIIGAIFQDGLHIDSFKLPVACSCRVSNKR